MSANTKLAIASALKKILLDKPFSKITIKDITDSCGISRMTFYYYFENVYDLLRWSVRNDFDKAIGYNSKNASWNDKLLTLFSIFYDNRLIVLNLNKEIRREFTATYLNDLIHYILSDALKEHRSDARFSDEDIDFMASTYTYGITGLLLSWVDDGIKEPPEALISDIYRMIGDHIDRGPGIYEYDRWAE